jgi:hypothetical protein
MRTGSHLAAPSCGRVDARSDLRGWSVSIRPIGPDLSNRRSGPTSPRTSAIRRRFLHSGSDSRLAERGLVTPSYACPKLTSIQSNQPSSEVENEQGCRRSVPPLPLVQQSSSDADALPASIER